jgi:hypothetical protein
VETQPDEKIVFNQELTKLMSEYEFKIGEGEESKNLLDYSVPYF